MRQLYDPGVILQAQCKIRAIHEDGSSAGRIPIRSEGFGSLGRLDELPSATSVAVAKDVRLK